MQFILFHAERYVILLVCGVLFLAFLMYYSKSISKFFPPSENRNVPQIVILRLVLTGLILGGIVFLVLELTQFNKLNINIDSIVIVYPFNIRQVNLDYNKIESIQIGKAFERAIDPDYTRFRIVLKDGKRYNSEKSISSGKLLENIKIEFKSNDYKKCLFTIQVENGTGYFVYGGDVWVLSFNEKLCDANSEN